MSTILRELPLRVARLEGAPPGVRTTPMPRLFGPDASDEPAVHRFEFEERAAIEASLPRSVERAAVCFNCPTVVFDAGAMSPCPQCSQPVPSTSLATTRQAIMGAMAQTWRWDHVSVWARLIIGIALVGLIPARIWWPSGMVILVIAGVLALVVALIAGMVKKPLQELRQRCEMLYMIVSANCPKCGAFREADEDEEHGFRRSRKWGKQAICPACRFPMAGGLLCACGTLYDEETSKGQCPNCGKTGVAEVYPRGEIII